MVFILPGFPFNLVTSSGAPQIVATCEFAVMAAWHASEDAQKVWSEMHALALNVSTELWGPPPVMPAPNRPGI
ncbi:MAG: hypothetical protein Kow002_18960 [Anaerolineales bacterium]